MFVSKVLCVKTIFMCCNNAVIFFAMVGTAQATDSLTVALALWPQFCHDV